MMQPAGDLKQYMGYSNTQPLKHLSETSLTLSSSLQLSNQQQTIQVSIPSHSTVSQALSSVPSQSASVGSMLSHLQHQIPNVLSPNIGLQQQTLGPSTPHLSSLYENDDFLCDSLDSSSNSHKKRKLSTNTKNISNNLLNGVVNVKQETVGGGISPEPHANTPGLSATDDEYSFDFSGPDGSGMFLDSAYQCIRFQPFQQNTWVILCDHSLKELPPPNFRVDADKGFNFSNADDAFVCQKKNHFQLTVHIQPVGIPHYVKTTDGVKKIDHFYLHFNGVKVESPSQTIKVEQSQSDRSKRPFHPVPLDLNPDQVVKTTVGRLHFSETTSNNMRKKGKPNPDQRYFYLVVSLCVASGDLNYTVIAHSSERIIVRASNPGQFENDMELSWQRGQLADSIYHAGRVGINTDRPDEALVIHGNMKVTGHIVQPSDARAKTNIEEVDTKEQLKNVANMRIVRYQFLPEFAKHIGIGVENTTSTGVIAQEVQNLIPDAVQGAGDILLPSGEHIENFLVVNKERIFMENVGAVKELCKVTDNLETRIDELEKVNKKLNKVKRLDSFKSTSSGSTVNSCRSTVASSKKASHHSYKYKRAPTKKSCRDDDRFCNNYFLQAVIILLILIMAFCLVAMASLYVLEWRKRQIPIISFDVQETSSLFNDSSTREPSLLPALEVDKSRSNFENSIAVQGIRKESSRLMENKKMDSSITYTQSTKTMTQAMTAITPVSLNINRTSIPVFKPRIIGTPSKCRNVQPQSSECSIFCCFVPVSQRRAMFESSEDVAYSEAFSEGKHHFIELSDSQEVEDVPSKDLYNSENKLFSKIPNATNSSSDSSSSTTVSMMPSLSSNLADEHADHQNQLKPIRDILIIQRDKTLNEKNSTEGATDGGNDKMSAVNQFEQKVRSIYKSEKNPLELRDSLKRQKRGSKLFPRKDLPKAVESLRLLELNTTIGQEYCNTLQCAHRTGPSFSYLIPISKYMVEEYVTLQFNFAIPLIVDHCQPDSKPIACPLPQNGAGDLPHDYIREQNLTEEVDPSWRLPIGLYLQSAYRFRVQARSVVSDTPCALPVTELGYSFIEYVLVFQRTCEK
ncbi:myelin regulatory factor-like [Uloborus diversus]|uniref:myelin regulatory factor-like n=1 Tax=Uloborus diversus TaxID=327109 RepID=UPI00240914F5|nr:myelin regulatory factor-like [Uloborus diversus]